jgi:hypothetical protein
LDGFYVLRTLIPSARAQAKAAAQHDPAGRPYRTFRGLLEHLATLTRNQVRFTGTRAAIPMLTEPTSAQREAFNLLGSAIPLTFEGSQNTTQPSR